MKLELQLETPIEFVGMTLVKVWFNITYPTGYCTWAIQNEDGAAPFVSWFNFPVEVIEAWTDSDDVLFNYLKELKPWEEMIASYYENQKNITTTTEESFVNL
jgi:hypothetical protein